MGSRICCTQQDLQLGLGGLGRKWTTATQHHVCWLGCSGKEMCYGSDWCLFSQTSIMLKPSFGSSICIALKRQFWVNSYQLETFYFILYKTITKQNDKCHKWSNSGISIVYCAILTNPKSNSKASAVILQAFVCNRDLVNCKIYAYFSLFTWQILER